MSGAKASGFFRSVLGERVIKDHRQPQSGLAESLAHYRRRQAPGRGYEPGPVIPPATSPHGVLIYGNIAG
jgi:hypothetical protein